jgi:hypothetical protein
MRSRCWCVMTSTSMVTSSSMVFVTPKQHDAGVITQSISFLAPKTANFETACALTEEEILASLQISTPTPTPTPKNLSPSLAVAVSPSMNFRLPRAAIFCVTIVVTCLAILRRTLRMVLINLLVISRRIECYGPVQ